MNALELEKRYFIKNIKSNFDFLSEEELEEVKEKFTFIIDECTDWDTYYYGFNNLEHFINKLRSWESSDSSYSTYFSNCGYEYIGKVEGEIYTYYPSTEGFNREAEFDENSNILVMVYGTETSSSHGNYNYTSQCILLGYSKNMKEEFEY